MDFTTKELLKRYAKLAVGQPFSPVFGLGGAIYGNEWGASAGGLAVSLGVGLEYQISEQTVVTVVPTYQPIAFRQFSDSTGQERARGPLGFGVAHWLAVQFIIEARDPLSRW
jgi:hypothetical protein